MKKRLLLLATLLMVTISFAGTKEDFEKAYEKYEKTKNIEQLEKELLKISKLKTDNYTISSKFELAKIKIIQNKNEEARKYIEEILADKVVSSEGIKMAKTMLYSIEENYDKKTKILSELIVSDEKDLGLQIEMLKQVSMKGDTAKYDKLYKEYTKKISANEKVKASFDINLIEGLLAEKQTKNAEKVIKLYLNSKEDDLKALSNHYMALLKLDQNDLKEAIKYSDEASKVSKGIDPDIENLNYILAMNDKNYEKALNKLVILKNITKDKSVFFELISLSEMLGKPELAESTIKEFRGILDDKQNKLLNDTLSKLFLSDRMYKEALKYAEKAVKEDKVNDGYLVQGVAYANLNNKEQALKNVREAIEKNVEGAMEAEKQILDNLK